MDIRTGTVLTLFCEFGDSKRVHPPVCGADGIGNTVTAHVDGLPFDLEVGGVWLGP